MTVEAHPAWVAAIFARLQLAYGNRFGQQYGKADDADVRADWRKRLAAISPERIRYALEHLPPDHPPNAMQFVALCKQMPQKPLQAISGPPATTPPGQVLDRLAGTIQALGGASPTGHDPRAWAYRLRDRELAGEKLSAFQKNAWRVSVRAPAVSAAFSPGIQEPSIHAGSSPSEPETL